LAFSLSISEVSPYLSYCCLHSHLLTISRIQLLFSCKVAISLQVKLCFTGIP